MSRVDAEAYRKRLMIFLNSRSCSIGIPLVLLSYHPFPLVTTPEAYFRHMLVKHFYVLAAALRACLMPHH